ncbi:MAG: hypothetical protein JNL32_15725, partial [Candidatus Kapabacteria bacterium]|nr:hypothetical protein [Candidatus Kapabacteria bacterium]
MQRTHFIAFKAVTLTERLARIDVSIRPLITSLPSGFVTKLYSHGRKTFVTQLNNDIPSPQEVPQHLFRTLWGIGFRSPLFNAA